MATYLTPIKNRKNYVIEEQVEALIDYFFDSSKNKPEWIQLRNFRKGMLIYTLWRTGRRISEIVGKPPYRAHQTPGLRPMDIDKEDRTITFSILKKNQIKKKNKAGAIKNEDVLKKLRRDKEAHWEAFAYDDQLIDTLIDYVKKTKIQPGQRIFPYDRSYVDQFIKHASKKLGLNLGHKTIINKEGQVITEPLKLSPHAFRHGFSMNFLENQQQNPLALPALQELLVHSSLDITKVYLKVDQTNRRKMLNKAFHVEKEEK